MESKELDVALDLFGQAVRDMTKREIEGADSEPSAEFIQSGLHAELCRSDVVKAVTAEVERAKEQSYKQGWNDRENDFFDRVDMIYGPQQPQPQKDIQPNPTKPFKKGL